MSSFPTVATVIGVSQEVAESGPLLATLAIDPSIISSPPPPPEPVEIKAGDPVTQAVVDNIIGKLPTKKQPVMIKCEVCNISVPSEKVMENHLNGAKHAKKLQAQERLKELPCALNPESYIFTVPNGLGGFQYGTCRICDVKINSEIMLHKHLTGAKHKQNVADMIAKTETVFLRKTKNVNDNQTQLSGAVQVNIGPNLLYCATCDVQVNSGSQFKQHINSLKHKAKKKGFILLPNKRLGPHQSKGGVGAMSGAGFGFGRGLRGGGLGNRGVLLGKRGVNLGNRGVGLVKRGVNLVNRGVGLGNRGVGLVNRGVGLGNRGVGLSNRGVGSGNRGRGVSEGGIKRGTGLGIGIRGAVGYVGRGGEQSPVNRGRGGVTRGSRGVVGTIGRGRGDMIVGRGGGSVRGVRGGGDNTSGRGRGVVGRGRIGLTSNRGVVGGNVGNRVGKGGFESLFDMIGTTDSQGVSGGGEEMETYSSWEEDYGSHNSMQEQPITGIGNQNYLNNSIMNPSDNNWTPQNQFSNVGKLENTYGSMLTNTNNEWTVDQNAADRGVGGNWNNSFNANTNAPPTTTPANNWTLQQTRVTSETISWNNSNWSGSDSVSVVKNNMDSYGAVPQKQHTYTQSNQLYARRQY